MKHKSLSIMLLIIILFVSPVFGQTVEEVKSVNLGLEEAIPIDPDITIGEFENGVDYYIKVNKKPENRATFWLVVNAGSVLEDDNQQFMPGRNSIKLSKSLTLSVNIPEKADIRLFRNGEIIKRIKGKSMTFLVEKKGLYRVEVYKGKYAWIYSNPFPVGSYPLYDL